MVTFEWRSTSVGNPAAAGKNMPKQNSCTRTKSTDNAQSQRLISRNFRFCLSLFSMRFYFDFYWAKFDVMFADFSAFTACCTATHLYFVFLSFGGTLRVEHKFQFTKMILAFRAANEKPNVIEIRSHALTSNRWKMEQKSSVRDRELIVRRHRSVRACNEPIR